MKFDDLIVNYLGEFGAYQKLQFFLVCLPTVFTAMYALQWTFVAANVKHRCRMPDESATADYWLGNNTMFNLSERCTNNSDTQQYCFYKECQIGTKILNLCPQGYIFDRSVRKFTATERWNLVCDREILKALIQSSYYYGQMIGSLVFGFLGDRIGRKKVFITALIMQIAAGMLMFAVPNWVSYFVLRMIVGCAHPGIFVIAVVIGMELAGPSKRKLASVMTGMFFSFGQVILGTLAYFFQDYRHLQALVAAPTLFFLCYWWIIPESARWLISQKRFKEADIVLQRVARFNKTSLPEKWWEDEEICGVETTNALKETQKNSFLDLFRTPKIRKISFSIFFCWPVVSMIYYGISMNPTYLGGNLYYNFLIGGIVEIPAVLFVYFFIDKIGRKPLLAAGLIFASLSSLSNLVIGGKDSHKLINITQFIIVKSSITATYATIYTFTPELFPTVIRNTAMGFCSMIARFGAIISSFISMWLINIYGKAVMIIPFSMLGILAAIFLLVALPETNGSDLYETIEELEGKTKAYELQLLQTEPKLSEKKK